MNRQKLCFLLLVWLVSLPSKLMAIEMGTIALEVGESYSVVGDAGGAQAQSGTWSVDGDAIFSITAKSQTRCTIRANRTGTSRLKYSFSYFDSNYNYKSYIAYWTIKISAATVYVTSVTLNTTSSAIGVGDTQQLTATVLPSDATNKSVTWSSSSTSIATVSSSGLVTAKSIGSATITCRANDGSGKQATCAVTVKEPVKVTGISLNFTTANLKKDETLQLAATVSPADASNKNIAWASSDKSIATVNDDGLVTAVAYGSVSVTCTAQDGSGKQATCAVTVKEPVKVTGISLSFTTANLKKDETLQLAATVSPADADNDSVTWSSSDEKIATVDTTGLVVAVDYGKAVITCMAKDGSGVKSTCDITVAKPDNWINSGNYAISWFNKSKDEFTISTAKELAGMAYIVNNGYTDFYGKTIRLAADIDLSGKEWTPCNIFRGTFDGDGHTISGIDINWEQRVTTSFNDTIFVGLWRKIYNAEIRNVNLSGKYSAHCINDYTTYSRTYISIGGLAGEIWNTTIERCVSDVNIELSCDRKSYDYLFQSCCLGGLCGNTALLGGRSVIRYCRYTGQLSCTGDYSPTSYYGGMIGHDFYGFLTIEYCENAPSLPFVYNTDNTRDVYIGGIIGSGNGPVLCCSNKMDSIVIKKCLSLVIGGIVGSRSSGYEKEIKNCYSYIGEVHVKEGNSNRCYFGGILSRSDDLNTSGPTACFSNNDVRIITEKEVTRVHDGSTSFSSAQMQTAAFLEELNMYSAFNMDGPVWVQPAEGGYPYIAALGEPTAVKPIASVESKNSTVYTLSGQRIATPRKGINIVGGKKVIIR